MKTATIATASIGPQSASGIIAPMKTRIAALAMAAALAGGAMAADIPTLRWRINVEQPAAYAINLIRGESVILEPEFYQGREPLLLSGVYEAILRYRDESLAAGHYYQIVGTVSDAPAGRLRFEWGNTNEAAAATYTYTIAAKSAAGAMLRGYGVIRLSGSVSGVVTNLPPRTITTFDWADVEHINPEAAPFVGPSDLLAVHQRLDGHDQDIEDLQAVVSGAAAIVSSNLNAHIEFQAGRDTGQDAAIAAAAASATTGGDASGPSTNMTVTGLRNVPVAPLAPGAAMDGYALKYDHATGNLILGPVAAAGTTISNIVVISGTNASTAVPAGSIGLYRTIRPGNLPSAVVNVGGFEVAWLDLLGITLRTGTLQLLGNWLNVNTRAYDGTVSAPAKSYLGQHDMGQYRFSTGSGYAEGYAINGERIWHWDGTGIVLAPNKTINGYANPSDLIARVAELEGMTNQLHLVFTWGEHAAAGYATTAEVAQVAADLDALDNRVQIVEGWGDQSEAVAGALQRIGGPGQAMLGDLHMSTNAVRGAMYAATSSVSVVRLFDANHTHTNAPFAAAVLNVYSAGTTNLTPGYGAGIWLGGQSAAGQGFSRALLQTIRNQDLYDVLELWIRSDPSGPAPVERVFRADAQANIFLFDYPIATPSVALGVDQAQLMMLGSNLVLVVNGVTNLVVLAPFDNQPGGPGGE